MESPNMMEAIYRMTKENNDMLHSMRRTAFLGGVFKFIMYVILFVGPLWFYMTYMNATVTNLITALNQVQGTGASVSQQTSGIAEQFKKLEAMVPGFLSQLPKASSTPKQ